MKQSLSLSAQTTRRLQRTAGWQLLMMYLMITRRELTETSELGISYWRGQRMLPLLQRKSQAHIARGPLGGGKSLGGSDNTQPALMSFVVFVVFPLLPQQSLSGQAKAHKSDHSISLMNTFQFQLLTDFVHAVKASTALLIIVSKGLYFRSRHETS